MLAIAAIAVALSTTGCRDRGAAPVSHLPTAAPVSPPAASGRAGSPTTLAGFDGWSVIELFSVDLAVDNGSLVMTLTHPALWLDADRQEVEQTRT